MAELPKMQSYFDHELRISLEMPESWTTTSTEVFALVLLAPEQDGYRANLGFSRNELAVPDPERLEEIIAETKEDQKVEYTAFQQTEEKRFWQDGLPAYWQCYEWQPEENDLHFSQIFSLIVAGPDLVYDIHGATLKHLEDRHIPIFRHILHSIRYIPVEE
jgi:hypothetical protein